VDIYNFIVSDFDIHDTRALHNDTLSLSLFAFVDGDMVGSRTFALGDFDSGGYATVDLVPDPEGTRLPPIVVNDPSSKVAFSFQLLNAGNVSADALTGRAASTADQMAGIASGLAGVDAHSIAEVMSSGAFIAGLALEAFANLWSWLNVDCDGPVAVDQLSGPRYAIDAWTDDRFASTGHRVIVVSAPYKGTDSPTGCGGNSSYDVTWSVGHARTWMPVATPDAAQPLTSSTGIAAAAHYGALHAFGVMPGGVVTHARTFTGATWSVDDVGTFDLLMLPVAAASFDDRLHVFGVLADGSISALAYTVDGGAWTPHMSGPAGLQTAEAITCAVFRNRLFVFARDAATNALRGASTADLRVWSSWVDVPPNTLAPSSSVSAVALGDQLHLFGTHPTGKKPPTAVVHNASTDGQTWTGWQLVEGGVGLEDQPGADLLDVAAGSLDERIYLASRWQWTDPPTDVQVHSMGLNFSADGQNWAGWRVPQSDVQDRPSAAAGVASVHNHLYVVAPQFAGPGSGSLDDTQTWAY
jgi:hypothetical protein